MMISTANPCSCPKNNSASQKGKSCNMELPGNPGIMGILCGIVGVGLLMTCPFREAAEWIPIAFIVLVFLAGCVSAVNK